jgi:hypothetical protein
MVVKMTEWAGMMLLAIAFSRFLMIVTNSDPDSVWDATTKAEDKVMGFLGNIRDPA